MIYHSLENFTESLNKPFARWIIVTEKIVAKYWLDYVLEKFAKYGIVCETIVLSLQESAKTRKTKEFLEDKLIEMGVDRNTHLVALGGGVVTDLLGYTASSFMRGIVYINIPTTLMGMVDASIGGKTGVNHEKGKNLLGAFYLSKAVVLDSIFLQTLPEKDMDCGFSEIIKYGLALDEVMFEKIEKKQYELNELITKCVHWKLQVTREDFLDRGIRRVLNLGHTVGHALELLSKYTISHGDAVKVGLFVESAISASLGVLSKKEFLRIRALLQERNLDLSLFTQFDAHCIFQAMRGDKKSLDKLPHMVLVEKIGRCSSFGGNYIRSISEDIWETALQLDVYAL